VLRSRDLTGIEARTLPWLAGAHEAIAAFFEFDKGTGADNYKVAAAQIYNIPVHEVTKDQRQVGKVAVLALGFGGGASAFAKMAKVYRLDLADIFDIVYGLATPTIGEGGRRLEGARLEVWHPQEGVADGRDD
jgi:DNA polymerase